MKKAPLYSRSRRGVAAPEAPPAAATSASTASSAPPSSAAAPVSTAAAPPTRRARARAFAARHERIVWAVALLLVAALAVFWRPGAPARAPLTFEQIDHLVRKSIEEKPLTSAAARAYDKVIPSVVRVVGYDRMTASPHSDKKPRRDRESDSANPKGESDDLPGFEERGVGTGVVIVDNGTILTNLHVVMGAERVRVTFMDGLEAEAKLVNVMPEHDLAVLRAQKIPDDLFAATMRGTGDLAPGDRVMAVGFPFGIGPSASEGIVSGLKREFRSPEGERVLTNLIQFDAAANPGNSGGPLVTMDGEVVGIVTAILNPTKQRVFVGIGFAVPIENAAAGAGMPPF